MAGPSAGEKQGAARWARCPNCGEWVHVAEAMLALGTVDLHCPACEHEFPPRQATETV